MSFQKDSHKIRRMAFFLKSPPDTHSFFALLTWWMMPDIHNENMTFPVISTSTWYTEAYRLRLALDGTCGGHRAVMTGCVVRDTMRSLKQRKVITEGYE